LNVHTQLADWASRVAPHDAEDSWTDPLEWLFFPLDRNTKARESQAAAMVFEILSARESFNRRYMRIAVESIGVGDERPDLFRRRLEIKFPTIVEFLRHRIRRAPVGAQCL